MSDNIQHNKQNCLEKNCFELSSIVLKKNDIVLKKIVLKKLSSYWEKLNQHQIYHYSRCCEEHTVKTI